MGSGPKTLLCFHGYSQSGLSFAFLNKAIEPEFSLIALDFPFHGGTSWKEGLLFSITDLVQILLMICKEQSLEFQDLSLIGFSMGGRVALVETLPKKISRLVLIAPDGMRLNFWYWFVTQTWFGNRIFEEALERPSPVLGILRLLNRLKLVNRSIYKFISFYVHDKGVRKELYERWTTMRRFRPRLRQIKALIKSHKIPIRFLYGEHDRVIRFERGIRFIKGLESFGEIKVLSSGHLLLVPENAEGIVSLLKY